MTAPPLFDIDAGGTWLTNDRLWTCIVTPSAADLAVMLADGSRPTAVAMLGGLLAEKDGWSRLHISTAGHAAFVILPELALGSPDWNAANSLVAGCTRPVVVLAGFGFTLGSTLRTSIQRGEVTPTWTDQQLFLDDGGNYNGAWLWIKDDTGTRCWVLLKLAPEQRYEKAIVKNWSQGVTQVRVRLGDLTIFPIICFDLVDQSVGCAVDGVLAHHGNANRVLVATPTLDKRPSSGLWDLAIAKLVGNPTGVRIVVVTANGYPADPLEADDADDACRLRTGAFTASASALAPSPPHRNVRWLKKGSAGYVLRSADDQAAVGQLAWIGGPALTLGHWVPPWLGLWNNGAYVEDDRTIESLEVDRLLRRRRKAWADGFSATGDDPTKGWVERETERTVKDLFGPTGTYRNRGSYVAALLQPSAAPLPLNADEAHATADGLVRGTRALAVLRHALNAHQFSEDEDGVGFSLLDGPKRVRVWQSPDQPVRRTYERARQLAEREGSQPPVLVAGGGTALGTAPRAGWVEPTHLITEPVPTAGALEEQRRDFSILLPRCPAVFWAPISEVEDQLFSTSSASALASIRALCAPFLEVQFA